MIDVIVMGATGRMGVEVIKILESQKDVNVVAAITSSHGSSHERLDTVKPNRHGATVVIDFSSPEGLLRAAAWCMKNRVALVSGTTGISKRHEKALSGAGRRAPVLWSANMSFGINLMSAIIREFGENFRQYDLQLEEFHHGRKKDAPSGTALLLQKNLERATKRTVPKPLSGRGGGIFGIHKLWLMGEDETLTIEHTALNRKVFAAGAVMAARWVLKKKPGLYEFGDLFK